MHVEIYKNFSVIKNKFLILHKKINIFVITKTKTLLNKKRDYKQIKRSCSSLKVFVKLCCSSIEKKAA